MLKCIKVIGVITARKRSLGQGNMFTPLCHSVRRGGAWSRGVWSGGSVWSRGDLVWSHWGVPGPGGAPGLGGSGLGGCLVESPRTATAAGGTRHPTGMHSCCCFFQLV